VAQKYVTRPNADCAFLVQLPKYKLTFPQTRPDLGKISGCHEVLQHEALIFRNAGAQILQVMRQFRRSKVLGAEKK